MKQFLKTLVALWQGLQRRLADIDSGDLMVEKYGAAVRVVERLRAIGVWRDATLAAVSNFRECVLLTLRVKAQEDVTAALSNLARGKPPEAGILPGGMRGTPPTPDPIIGRLDGITQQLLIANSFQLSATQSTADIQARVNGYLEEARQGSEFSYRAYSIDRLVLAGILRGRAAAGDDRAAMTLDSFTAIERALIERAFPQLQDSDDGELAKCEEVTKGAIVGQGDAARENLKPASEWFGFLERGQARQQQFQEATGKLAAPAPRLEVDQDVLNRIAMGRQPPAPIARLWGDRS